MKKSHNFYRPQNLEYIVAAARIENDATSNFCIKVEIWVHFEFTDAYWVYSE